MSNRKLIRKYPKGSLVVVEELAYVSIMPIKELYIKFFGLIVDVDKDMNKISILVKGSIVEKDISGGTKRITVVQRPYKSL